MVRRGEWAIIMYWVQFLLEGLKNFGNGGDGCLILWIQLVPMICTLKNG